MHAPDRGRALQDRGSIIFDHEDAPCTDSKYRRHCPGRWRGVLSEGFGPDGRRRRYKVSGRTEQDVIVALKKSEELDAGLSTSRSYTAGRAAHDWLEHGLPACSPRPRRSGLSCSKSAACRRADATTILVARDRQRQANWACAGGKSFGS